MIEAVFLGLGLGLFLGAWNGYNSYPQHEDFFENLGQTGFWLFVIGLIFLIF